ncbi:hypothetical protein [Kribbella deserti]|uniref:Uncharacterized protein n=1 Tax=Kribbella deserti TaxID=1926257 RepID=A0ABV6QTK4_9ACTN
MPAQRPEPEPVFAPEVSPAVRRLFARKPELLVPASHPCPARRTAWSEPMSTLGSLLVWIAVCVGVWILALILFAVTFPPEVAAWLAVGLAAIGVASTAVIGVTAGIEPRDRKTARRHHGKYLLAADFDEPAARLMIRAQRAVRTVLGAEVTTRGLLDDMQNELVLPEQLWDLGQVLREQTVLRARQREVAGGMATAELEAVLGPQRRALIRSETAIERKVEALEKYAERVRVADAALRAEEALQDGDRYIELLARTEPVGDSTTVQGLADEVSRLQDTLARSIESARAAGRTLALPAES